MIAKRFLYVLNFMFNFKFKRVKRQIFRERTQPLKRTWTVKHLNNWIWTHYLAATNWPRITEEESCPGTMDTEHLARGSHP